MKAYLFFLLLLFYTLTFSQKKYHKSFYDNGNLKEEGWVVNHLKTGYWYFYRKDASKEKEGHFIKGKKSKWWIFYDNKEKIISKNQYKNDYKEGYFLVYHKKKIMKIIKYKKNKKIKEWTDISLFKKENSIFDLR